MSQSYYAQICQAFDLAAPTYDALYRRNQVMAWMRAESLGALQALFPPGSYLLEIGCGTGDEALTLSRMGYRIVATDISPAMIQAARAKAQAHGVDSASWRVLPAGNLAELAYDYDAGAFDGAYASFGALNCEPHMDQLVAALAHLLRPGAKLVCSVMNRYCGWEIAWGLIHLRPGQAFRRIKKGWVSAGLAAPKGHLFVPTRYYCPRRFARLFAPHFGEHRVWGLPVFLPPPYLDGLFEQHRSLFGRLESLERRLRAWFPFYALGDHFLIVMTRLVTGEER